MRGWVRPGKSLWILGQGRGAREGRPGRRDCEGAAPAAIRSGRSARPRRPSALDRSWRRPSRSSDSPTRQPSSPATRSSRDTRLPAARRSRPDPASTRAVPRRVGAPARTLNTPPHPRSAASNPLAVRVASRNRRPVRGDPISCDGRIVRGRPCSPRSSSRSPCRDHTHRAGAGAAAAGGQPAPHDRGSGAGSPGAQPRLARRAGAGSARRTAAARPNCQCGPTWTGSRVASGGGASTWPIGRRTSRACRWPIARGALRSRSRAPSWTCSSPSGRARSRRRTWGPSRR